MVPRSVNLQGRFVEFDDDGAVSRIKMLRLFYMCIRVSYCMT